MRQTRPLSILFFIESGGPGGAEQVVLSLAQGLRFHQHRITVVTLRTGWFTAQLEHVGIPHILLESSRARDFLLPFRLSKIIKDGNVDVLHSHLLDSNFYGAIASSVARVPHVATEHGDVHHLQKKRLLGTKLRFISLSGSTLTAVSQYTKSALQGYCSLRAQPLCIYNPVRLPSLHSVEVSLAAKRNLGVPEESWLWAHVANLRPVKNQELLLQAFRQLLDLSQSKPSHLFIAGDGPERPKLEALVQTLGIGAKVRFLGFLNDTSTLLQAADGFVLSSHSEAMPLSLLEAAAHGLFLVAPHVGGIPEVITDKLNGLLVTPGDSHHLAQALAFPVENFALAQSMAAAARETVASRFSVETITNQYEELYHRLLWA